MRKVFTLVAILAGLLMAACASQPAENVTAQVGDIQIIEAWARPAAIEGGNGAAYMVIRNTGGSDDRLISASSSVSEVTELHETFAMEPGESMEGMEAMAEGEMPMEYGDEHGDMMGMREVGEMVIPAGGETVLEVGGRHVMLIGVSEVLNEGDTVSITLTFENAGTVTFDVPVREQ